jgi:predicted AAA+ superfamily ATPase
MHIRWPRPVDEEPETCRIGILVTLLPQRSLLSIDYNPILPLLKGTPSSRSNAIYVIGNNGEGKSLMLRQLASDFSEQGRRVVGICFGASDRFPRSREEKRTLGDSSMRAHVELQTRSTLKKSESI